MLKKTKTPKANEKEVKKPTKTVSKKEAKQEEELVVNDKYNNKSYHISQDKKDKKWKLFIAGSDKVIKKFDTQMEAYGAAMNLSEKNDRGVIVHSRKGKIRKI